MLAENAVTKKESSRGLDAIRRGHPSITSKPQDAMSDTSSAHLTVDEDRNELSGSCCTNAWLWTILRVLGLGGLLGATVFLGMRMMHVAAAHKDEVMEAEVSLP